MARFVRKDRQIYNFASCRLCGTCWGEPDMVCIVVLMVVAIALDAVLVTLAPLDGYRPGEW